MQDARATRASLGYRAVRRPAMEKAQDDQDNLSHRKKKLWGRYQGSQIKEPATKTAGRSGLRWMCVRYV